MYSLHEDVINHVKWVFGNLESNGLMLKCQGVSIKIGQSAARALIDALKNNEDITINTYDDKKFSFTHVDDNVMVKEVDESATDMDALVMTKDEVDELLKLVTQ